MTLQKFILYRITLWLLMGMAAGSLVQAQVTPSGIYIDLNKSDPKARRDVNISGNRVVMYISNWGQVANSVPEGGGVWPRGTNHDHLHMLSPFMAARVPDKTGRPIYIVSEGYMEMGKRDPGTNIDQKFQPLAGYYNPNQLVVPGQLANQLNPDSWPSSWPGKDSRWSGFWNGYFGLNQKNADQEAYFVMDDAWNNKLPFYPNKSDTTRRGLGLQIEVRNFQWSHPLAQDVIFTHYQVANTGDYDYQAYRDSLYFGSYADFNAGGGGMTNDDASFDLSENMVYCWADKDQVTPHWNHQEILPGYMGWKFLESPGIWNDGIDNDNDGITDERRDNDAGEKIVGKDNILAAMAARGYDMNKFYKYYRYKTADDIPAIRTGVWWTGDENANWDSTFDDKGADGIGSGEEGYPGPDLDGTEGNGRPDQGEPHFGKTDINESDMVGLASFSAPNYNTIYITNESQFWPVIQRGYFKNPPTSANQFWIFSSGPFNLAPGQVERFSTCIAFGFDLTALYRTALVAQRIYEAGYQFAKPPIQPKLKAIAGNKKVTLVWDALSELSYDPIYHHDFEGYKVIRSTDPQFMDASLITDAYGTKTYMKPIAQFDLVDGLVGMHPIALGEEVGGSIEASQGILYFMGTDTGLQHYYIDSLNVMNGRTYYYAIIAYDRGFQKGFGQRGFGGY